MVQGEKKSQFKVITETYVVLNKKGSVNELYKLTRDWINETYNDPEQVIISDTNSKFLKIQGYKENMFTISGMGYTLFHNARYRLEFKFRENKIRVEISTLSEYDPPSRSGKHSGRWIDKDLIMVSKKNGKPEENGIKHVAQTKIYFNNLVIDLLNHKTGESSEDAW